MATSEEINLIKQSATQIVESLDWMTSIAELISSNTNIINAVMPLQNKDIAYLKELPAEATLLKNDIVFLKNLNQNISDNFKTFAINEFSNSYKNIIAYSDQHTYHLIKKFIDDISSEEDIQINQNAIFTLESIFSLYKHMVTELKQKTSLLGIFIKIKDITNNIVMIGSNGSGKSTFSRQLKGVVGPSENFTILSAQPILSYSPSDSINRPEKEIGKVHSFHSADKLTYEQRTMHDITSDMNQLISALIALHVENALNYYDSNKNKEENTSDLEQTIEIWEGLIKDRAICINTTFLNVITKEGHIYDFNNLSDGEKAVFYYIGHVLLSKNSSYIIIDEPENHLHASVCCELWDTLELIRNDCTFIYLTHDLDFAASRNDATVIWNQNFTPPNNWNFEILESIDEIPDALLFSLVGSKKPICFCEGDTSSLDYKLYSLLLPEYNIKPVGGHKEVIAYTRAFNKNKLIFENTAIGIIDGDFHEQGQISKWASDRIYTLKTNEIENVICDELLLDKAIIRFCSKSNAKNSFMDSFWRKLETEKESIALERTRNIINEHIDSCLFKSKTNISDLINEINELSLNKEANHLYSESLKSIERVLTAKNYEEALRITNLKNALTRNIAEHTIVNNFEERIVGLIRSDKELIEYIRNKFLPDNLFTEQESVDNALLA